jgi:hypothetical protein
MISPMVWRMSCPIVAPRRALRSMAPSHCVFASITHHISCGPMMTVCIGNACTCLSNERPWQRGQGYYYLFS